MLPGICRQGLVCENNAEHGKVIHTVIFWVMVLCSLVGGKNISMLCTASIFRAEDVESRDSTYLCLNSERHNMNLHRHENLESHLK